MNRIPDPAVRGVIPPLNDTHLRPLGRECRRIQIYEPLSDAEHHQLAKLLAQHPWVGLRLVGIFGRPFSDLKCLRAYSGLRSLALALTGGESIEGLDSVAPTLTTLILESSEAPPLPKGMLSQFQRLQSLSLPRSLPMLEEAVRLPDLRVLSLSYIVGLDLSILQRASKLRALSVALGSVVNSDGFADLARLMRLDIWRARGVEDLAFLSRLTNLRSINLQDLPKVECLPSLAKLERLHRLVIQGMKSLTDISGAADSPSLSELLVFASPKLTPESFKPFVGHPSLTHASVALGTVKKNTAIKELMSLPEADRFGKGIFEDESFLKD